MGIRRSLQKICSSSFDGGSARLAITKNNELKNQNPLGQVGTQTENLYLTLAPSSVDNVRVSSRKSGCFLPCNCTCVWPRKARCSRIQRLKNTCKQLEELQAHLLPFVSKGRSRSVSTQRSYCNSVWRCPDLPGAMAAALPLPPTAYSFLLWLTPT